MDEETIVQAELYEALFHSVISPIFVTDRSGAVVEWNRAAELYTGITRSEAVGTVIWDLQARIAPATTPYEEALDNSHTRFRDYVSMSDSRESSWHETLEGHILSTNGIEHEFKVEVFPIRVRDRLYIVGIVFSDRPNDQTELVQYAPQTIAGGC